MIRNAAILALALIASSVAHARGLTADSFNPNATVFHRGQEPAGTPSDRGLLANRILLRQPVKSVYFFAGNWRHGVTKFNGDKAIGDNVGLYTLFPADSRHLGWSETKANRTFALDEMQRASVNTITMSYWGRRGDDRWAFWAPMYTSTYAHDELFDEAVSRNMVILPAIESGRCTQGLYQGWSCKPDEAKPDWGWWGRSWSFNFASEFPWFKPDPRQSANNPAPLLVAQIKDLLQRYVIAPANPLWPSRWAQIYDREGTPRYAINLIHVASNQIGSSEAEHALFALSFDLVADKVYEDTGYRVGFTLDVLPTARIVDQNCGCANDDDAKWKDTFVTSPEVTGPYLRDTSAVLAIQGFNSEIWSGHAGDENGMQAWKADVIRRWVANGPPVFLDVDPGHDNHLVFPDTAVSWGYTDSWFNFQSELKATGIRGITFNTWNGYTEGYVAVPVARSWGTDYSAYTWLAYLYSVDPQVCDHWHFLNRQPTYHVYGAICEKWRALGGSFGALGAPTSSEYDIACVAGARWTNFVFGDVVWTPNGGAFEVHGDIAKVYRQMKGPCGAAGMPLSDESGPPDQRVSVFEHGKIFWSAGGGAFYVPNPGGIQAR